ncbi:energy-coupling factor ABC transporter permease [Streptomyces sp. VNUA116]|uniref:energy-coupling factor ABC transporter permease n=1 Tax=Streptomyces sp. VNUA116 TaxID=3062449 RepID=UPI002674B938|nr:energy-coupling factor ABC transporter permease [Streptomyces sp. VNUA116]WKU45261.1 energy-coupling factor ABC transporter permease [Streptomyces sp. VNUA116]
MHVPDGFIDAPVSAATAAVAAAAVGVSLRGARRELDDKAAPLAGLVAAFVFAVQMLNFPVAAGTSGHLLGGALAAILVGPYTGVLCISVVLLMQGVLFADGGLTALGVNITDMGVVTTVVAYAVFRALVRVLPRGRTGLSVASFAAAFVSVPAAAAAFTLIYALGGTTDVPVSQVFTAMTGVHVLIGLGEAAITALTVSAVAAVRPDLVHGARDLLRPLELRTVRPTNVLRPDGAEATSSVPGSPAISSRRDGDQPERRDPAVPDGLAAEAASSVPGSPAVSSRRDGDQPERRDPAVPDGPSGDRHRRSGSRGPGAVAAEGRAEAESTLPGSPAISSRRDGDQPERRDPAVPDGPSGDRHRRSGSRGLDAVAAEGVAEAASGSAGAGTATEPENAIAPRSAKRLWLVGVAAALVCAGGLSYYASTSPDGLEKVAHDKGIDSKEEAHAAKDSPLADYQVKDVSDERLSGGLAGVIGVGATLAAGTGVFVTLRWKRTRAHATRTESETAAS